MAYGMQVYGPSGEVWFDSNLAVAGVPTDYVVVAANAAGFTRTYPVFPGRTAKAVSLDLGGAVGGVTFDYILGYPRMTVTQDFVQRAFAVVMV